MVVVAVHSLDNKKVFDNCHLLLLGSCIKFTGKLREEPW